jgi:hypothetical protein
MVDLARENFLPAAGLPSDQHGRWMRRDEVRTHNCIAHCWAASNELCRRIQTLKIGPQFATLDVRAARQLRDPLNDIEVTRCRFNDPSKHVAKLRRRIRRR